MILGQFRWVDLLDLVLVWVLVYRILLLVRKTGAMQILSGLGFLSIVYILSIRWEIFTFQWLLDRFFSHLFLIVVILFQTEIRRTLAHIGSHPIFSGVSVVEESHIIEEIAKSVLSLAQKGYGALVVLEKEIAIDYHMEAGTRLDGIVTSAMLESIFQPTSPMHDGAVVIRNGRIYSAGCVLPLSKNPVLDKNLGTRHRAALGLTEETDSLVLVVSEETKSLGVAQSGHLTPNVDSNQVRKMIYEFYDLKYKGVS
jgi:diadenylate cyclase